MFKRRDFIKSLGLTTAAYFTLGEDAIGEVQKNQAAAGLLGFYPIRIRGKVFSGGKGISNVVVSDGRVVVKTNENGEYELISGSDREFVFVSQPSGFEIKNCPMVHPQFLNKLKKRERTLRSILSW